MVRCSKALGYSSSLLIGVFAITGCYSKQQLPDSNQSQDLSQLERRVKKIEDNLSKTEPTNERDEKTPSGPIKSLTFRMGTVDDRLRIYWADGRSSDLPCNQEGQGVWACG